MKATDTKELGLTADQWQRVQQLFDFFKESIDIWHDHLIPVGLLRVVVDHIGLAWFGKVSCDRCPPMLRFGMVKVGPSDIDETLRNIEEYSRTKFHIESPTVLDTPQQRELLKQIQEKMDRVADWVELFDRHLASFRAPK